MGEGHCFFPVFALILASVWGEPAVLSISWANLLQVWLLGLKVYRQLKWLGHEIGGNPRDRPGHFDMGEVGQKFFPENAHFHSR